MRFPNPSLLCTTGFCTFLMSCGLLRRCHLAGQGWAQAASLWAFCLQVHRVGPSVGVVESTPRQATSPGALPWLLFLPVTRKHHKRSQNSNSRREAAATSVLLRES